MSTDIEDEREAIAQMLESQAAGWEETAPAPQLVLPARILRKAARDVRSRPPVAAAGHVTLPRHVLDRLTELDELRARLRLSDEELALIERVRELIAAAVLTRLHGSPVPLTLAALVRLVDRLTGKEQGR